MSNVPVRSTLAGSAVALLLCTLLTVAPGTVRADELPASMLSLLPEDPAALVVVPSIDGLSSDVRRAVEIFDPETAAEFDPAEMLEGLSSNLSRVCDTSQPAALAVSLVEGVPMPYVVGIVGLLDPSMDEASFEANVGQRPLFMENGWVVLGNHPAYQPGRGRPQLLMGMPPTDVAARVDLRRVFDHFGPMLDMMIQMALSQPAPVDSTADPDAVPQPIFDQEGIDAALALLGMVRDGLDGLELGLEVEGDGAEIHAGVAFAPDGPLALGPQTDPSAALALARRLPVAEDAALITASALDLSSVLPLIEGVLAMMDDVQTPGQWTNPWQDSMNAMQASLADLYEVYWLPNAATMGVEEAGFTMDALVEAGAPAVLIDRTTRTMLDLSLPGTEFVELDRREIDGREVRGYRFDMDVEEMMAAYGGNVDEAGARDMERLFAEVWPVWEFTSMEELMLVSTARDGRSGMEGLLDAVRTPRDLPARLQEVVDWAGPDARSWTWMDLKGMLGLMAVFFEHTPEDPDVDLDVPSLEELRELPPMPVLGAASIEGTWLRGRLGLDLRAIATFSDLVNADEED